jgi:hypothetical protein
LTQGVAAIAALTGPAAVPPAYAFGFLACRWGWDNRSYIEQTLHEFRHVQQNKTQFLRGFRLRHDDLPRQARDVIGDNKENTAVLCAGTVSFRWTRSSPTTAGVKLNALFVSFPRFPYLGTETKNEGFTQTSSGQTSLKHTHEELVFIHDCHNELVFVHDFS